MVSGVAHRPEEDGSRGASSLQRPPQPAGTRSSLGTPPPSGGAQSASTSGGSVGSPSSRSEQHGSAGGGTGAAHVAAAVSASTPASESTFVRLNTLEIHGEDAPSSQAPASKKKKRGARAVGPDKGGRGLRQFSMKVCEKVESKGRTTYNEVADELVAEFADPNNSIESPDPDNPNAQQYDEKNIRRRVYDALNVLMAMDIISKDKKEIQWKGLPRTSINDIEELQTDLMELKGRIEKKSSYLQELQDQYPEEYGKAFRIYTQLWRMQQEHRHRLLDAGLRRWQVGEIAARIAHLYYSQYQRTSDTALLSEAFVFYHAVLDRAYFVADADHLTPTKHLRFLARFLLVALILARHADTVPRLAAHIRTLLDESKKTLQEAEYKEWKHVLQEIARFLKADSPFMNMRPLRYSYAFDPPPDALPTVPPTVKKRSLVLSDAILCSYYHNEVKFTDLTIDVFRMLQALEWEPCGSFALNNAYNTHDESGQNNPNLLKDLRDAALPPNPIKTILYRPSVTHFLTVLASKCEELPSNGMLLIYLSAAGEVGSSGFCPDTSEKVVSSFSKFGVSNNNPIDLKEDSKPCLWLGCRANEGSNCIYPCDLIPFTRRPLFLVIDSSVSYAFKSIHLAEMGETTAMLLSPSSRSSTLGFSGDSTWQNGSQFTMFLTTPLQAFCFLIGNNGVDIDRDTYNKAEELLSLSLNEWATTLVASSLLHPVWVEVLGDPLLRRLLLRFIFCRATHLLLKSRNHKLEFLPMCSPPLPESVDAESMLSQCCVMRVASFFGVVDQFSFAEVTTWPDVDTEDSIAMNPNGSANNDVPFSAGDSDTQESLTSSF